VYRCIICRFPVDLDDAIAPTPSGACVCYRCFARETDTPVAMPKALRKELSSLLEDEYAA
jgi:hypothetical protein